MNYEAILNDYNAAMEAAGRSRMRLKDIQRAMKLEGIKVSESAVSMAMRGVFPRTAQTRTDMRYFLNDFCRTLKQTTRSLKQPAASTKVMPAAAQKTKEIEMLKPTYVPPKVLNYFGVIGKNARNPFDGAAAVKFENPALQDLRYSIEDCLANHKFIALVGAVGSGKTSLVNDIEKNLRRNESNIVIRPQFFAPEKINKNTMVEALIRDMTGGTEGACRSYEKSADKFMRTYRRQAESGKNFIVIIDNAHELQPGAFNFLKRVYDIELDEEQVMSVILVGETGLRREIEDNPELSEVTQRLTVLTMPSYERFIKDYVMHRAGKEFVKHIAPDAFAPLTSQRQPITPLYLNNLMMRAMVKAHNDKSESITSDIIKLAMA